MGSAKYRGRHERLGGAASGEGRPCVRQRSLLFTSPAPPLRLHGEAMTIPSALNRDRAQSLPSDLDALRQRIEATARKSGARAVAVALHDIETGADLHYDADRWFHGASTIKVAILLAVYGEIDRGRLVPQSRLHVRNRFLSAYDGSPFRIQADRDADSEVHAAIGKTMRVSELALHMIATSSNLATNLLLDLIGLDAVQRTIDRFSLTGLDVRRGVEDEKAFEHEDR